MHVPVAITAIVIAPLTASLDSRRSSLPDVDMRCCDEAHEDCGSHDDDAVRALRCCAGTCGRAAAGARDGGYDQRSRAALGLYRGSRP